MKNKNNTRREFLQKFSGAGLGLAALSATPKNAAAMAGKPPPIKGKYMGDFVAPRLDQVKVAFIGCGARSGTHVSHLATFESTEVVGICDLYQDLAEGAKTLALKSGGGERHKNIKLYHGDPYAYKKMLAETKPDLVYVITPWEWHAPMAVDAMNAGAHVGVEVPISVSINECWNIIDTSERTQRHCMMLENVNYGREELLYLNMCRKGIFGELLHGEAAYIHELRGQLHQVEEGRGTGSWRAYHWANETGNLYPTHGLGPVAQYMNIARTDDNFRRLVSFSSPAKNHELYVEENFPEGSKVAKIDFDGGDINTSIIKTQMGRTIMVQWDESSPRPYSRHNLIQGTKGTAAGFPSRIALDYSKDEAGLPDQLFKLLAEDKDHTNFHKWQEDLEAFYEAFDHPLYKRMEAKARKLGGHGGMDAIMNARLIECLRTGQPLDQNVYEGCLWSAVSPLSRKSVAEDGMPQDFPDFTRGRWKTTKPLSVIS